MPLFGNEEFPSMVPEGHVLQPGQPDIRPWTGSIDESAVGSSMCNDSFGSNEAASSVTDSEWSSTPPTATW